MKNLKEFEVYLDNELEEGIELISFVKDPAIQTNFIALSSEPILLSINEEKQIVITPALIPDKKIYRFNETVGEHYIKFTRESIYKIVQNYFKNARVLNFNLEHSEDVSGVYTIESYIVDRENGVNPHSSFADLPDGTWMVTLKVDNPNLWKAIKAGQFKGISVEGMLSYKELDADPDEEELSLLKDIYKELSKIK